MKIAFVINSRIKSFRQRSKEISETFSGHHDVSLMPTNHHGHARLLADEAVDERFDLIIVVGGDGTINQCVNGMLETGMASDQLPALAIWPGGSGNDFSRTHRCPKTIEQLLQTVHDNQAVAVDVGKITNMESGTSNHFVNIAEIGLGTTVIQRAERMQRWIGDRLGYQMAIMRTVAMCPEFDGKVSGDEFSFRGRFSTIAVANAKYYGSGLGVAPPADISDGLLDVVLLRAFTPLDFIRYMGKLKRCEPIKDSRVQIYQTSKLSVEGRAATSMDGELGGRLPVEISILPGQIRILQFGK